MFYKPEIRDKIQQRRKELDLVSIAQASQAVAAQVVQMREFLEGRRLGAYLSIDNELDPLPILHCAQTLKKEIYLPVINANSGKDSQLLEFHQYVVGDPLMKGLHGVSGPVHQSQFPSDITDLDFILVPLVAFDSHCNRLGRGAGYYDRTLNAVKEKGGRMPYLIGLGYEFQKITQIATDKWDVPLDMVVTESAIHRRVD